MLQITTTIPANNLLALYDDYPGANEFVARPVLAIAVWSHNTGAMFVPVTLRDLTKKQLVSVLREDLVPLMPDVMIQDAELFESVSLLGEATVRQHELGAWELAS